MIGRNFEKTEFKQLLLKKTASLVIIRGRRRIGKSTFVENMAPMFDHFYEFQGLPPREASSNLKQLNHFAMKCNQYFKGPAVKFKNWDEAFSYLSSQTKEKGRVLVFLDEISWLGRYEKDFPGLLKIAWDLYFKKNNKLVLVICGSVSSWIKQNILNNTGFVGRISLNIKLEELSLKESLELARINNDKFSGIEKVKYLIFTGGVPKYLEEIIPQHTPEKNIERLFLSPNGAFHNEFQNIFNDIFESKSDLYKKILNLLVDQKFSASELATKLKLPLNGDLTQHLDNLLESGFISKEYAWNFDTLTQQKKPKYRVSDNFIRFYLKYIDKLLLRSEGLKLNIQNLKNWQIIVGLQFENVLLKNVSLILDHLNVSPADVIQFGPYLQKTNSKLKGCQFDLIVQTKYNVLYIFEFKTSNTIDQSLLKEFKEKVRLLKIKRNFSYRTGLIYTGELSSCFVDKNQETGEIFNHLISFDELIA